MKKNVLIYVFVYLSLAFMLIIPFISSENQILWTNTFIDDDNNKTKIELVCEDVVVGIIQSYPGEKIAYPSEVENNLSSYSNLDIEGWYTDKALTDKFVFDTQPSDNTILYAKVDTPPEQVEDKITFFIFWGISILSALALGILFFVLNKYYTHKQKVESNKNTQNK